MQYQYHQKKEGKGQGRLARDGRTKNRITNTMAVGRTGIERRQLITEITKSKDRREEYKGKENREREEVRVLKGDTPPVPRQPFAARRTTDFPLFQDAQKWQMRRKRADKPYTFDFCLIFFLSIDDKMRGILTQKRNRDGKEKDQNATARPQGKEIKNQNVQKNGRNGSGGVCKKGTNVDEGNAGTRWDKDVTELRWLPLLMLRLFL